MRRIIDQFDVFNNIMCRPAASHQFVTGFGGIRRRTDRSDNLVDIGHGHSQTAQNVTAFACFAQFERGAARHNVFAKVNK